MLGRADLAVAAEAWDRTLGAEATRASSPMRGGGGGAQPRSAPLPNPFIALQREVTETHLQARSRHAAATPLGPLNFVSVAMC